MSLLIVHIRHQSITSTILFLRFHSWNPDSELLDLDLGLVRPVDPLETQDDDFYEDFLEAFRGLSSIISIFIANIFVNF